MSSFARVLDRAKRRACQSAQRPYNFRGPLGGGMFGGHAQPPAQGLKMWFNGAGPVYSDLAGTVPAAAPFGRVARVNQPAPAPAGAWLTPDGAGTRGWLDGAGASVDLQYGALCYFSQPVGLTVPAQNCVWGFSFQHRVPGNGNNNTIFGGSDAGGFFGLLINLTLFLACSGATHDTGVTIPAGASVYGFARWTAGHIDAVFFVNGVQHVFTQAVTTAAGNVTAVTLGNFASVAYAQLGAKQLLGYDNTTPVNTAALLSFLASQSPAPLPAAAPLFAVAGDSIAVGAGAVTQTSEFMLAQFNLAGNATPPRMVNDGTTGAGLVQITAVYPTQIKPLYNPARAKNILLVQAITNSMVAVAGQGAAVAAATLSQYYAYCDQARADGWIVVAFTCLPRTDAGAGADFPVCWNIVNTDIRANYLSHASDLVDAAAVPGMSLLADATAGPNFQADHLHPTNAGHGLQAPVVAAAVARRLAA